MSSDASNTQQAPHHWSRQKTARQPWDQHSTPHKRAQEVFQEREGYFHAVWAAASDAMALSTPDGTVFAANPAYYQLYGYPPEEVLGHHFAMLFPEEQRPWARKLYDYLFTRPTIGPAVETPVRSADGTNTNLRSVLHH